MARHLHTESVADHGPAYIVDFLTEVTSPFAIDVTAAGLLEPGRFVERSNRIMRANLDGSNITTLLTGIKSYDFEVVGSQIYYTTTDGFVKRSNLDGSGLATLASGLGFLNGIDVTGDSIYVSALQGILRRAPASRHSAPAGSAA